MSSYKEMSSLTQRFWLVYSVSYQNLVKPDYTTEKHQQMRPSKRRKLNIKGEYECGNTINHK